MEQEEFVPDYAQTSREIWIQQTYEEIKKRTYLDPLYNAASLPSPSRIRK
ncbi:hypothetical protein [Fibrobacter sp.]